MKKIIILMLMSVIFVLFVGADPIATWEREQLNAKDVFDSTHIQSAGVNLRRTVHNVVRHFGYEGYLFNHPIRRDYSIADSYFFSRGLTNTEFPRNSSTDHIIMWECLDNFKEKVAGRPGDYFDIYIMLLTESEYDSGSDAEGTLFIYLIGKFESDGSVTGNIWRRP